MDKSNEINKPSVDDMVFLSKDGTTELNFDDWFDEYISDCMSSNKLELLGSKIKRVLIQN